MKHEFNPLDVEQEAYTHKGNLSASKPNCGTNGKRGWKKNSQRHFFLFFLYIFSFHFLSRVLVNSPVFLGFSSSFFRQLRRSLVVVVAVVIDVAAAVAAAGVVVAVIAFVND